MENSKKNFLVYLSWGDAFLHFTDEQAGQVIKAAFQFHNGEEAKCADPMADFYARYTLLPVFRQNENRYEEVCAKRKTAINSRWGKSDKKYISIQKNTYEYKCIQKDTDKEKEKDNDMFVIGADAQNTNKQTSFETCDPDLLKWMQDNDVPFILANYSHLVTTSELEKLKEKYDVSKIMNTITGLENNLEYRGKYTNLYRVLLSWLKKEGRNG